MYRPKHRAPTRRPVRTASTATIGATALVLAALLAPSAYADTRAHFAAPGSHGPKAGKPGKPGKPGGPQDGKGSKGGQDSKGDHAADEPVEALKATAPPLTAYEMPFPCGEVWTGSTRAGHSPSVRSVDFNYAGGDLGKPVVAAAYGTVTTAVIGRKKPSYGQYVVIDHGNGESSLYAHLDSVLVAVGQVVPAGTQIGTVGATGNASGSHLHFEERVGKAVVDAWFHGAAFPMGTAQASQNCGGGGTAPVSTDIPLAGDMYGGRTAEVMVYRRGKPAAFHVTRNGPKERVIKIGDKVAQPFVGDWDGNGRVDPGVRDPESRVFTLQVKRKRTTVRFGKKGDLPVAGNWDGVGAWEIGVRRPTKALFLLKLADGTKRRVPLGDADDIPVTGDWDGNGVTDLGVYDQATATFTLLMTDPLGTTYTTSVAYGAAGDIPVTGDWDGNGVTDLGVWSPWTAVFDKRTAVAPTASRGRSVTLAFGRPNAG